MLGIRLSKDKKTIRIVNRDGTIRLNKDNKTVKVVNRTENLKLSHTGKTGPQGIQGIQGIQGESFSFAGEWSSSSNYLAAGDGEIDVVEWGGNAYAAIASGTNHEPGTVDGNTYWGLIVSKGDAGESTFIRVYHGTDANFARPSFVYVEWVGSVAPLNAIESDTWIDTTGIDAGSVISVNGRTGVVTLTKSDVSLANVDNTSDANKPISTLTQAALDTKVESVVAGTNVTVDNTDPLNPVVNASSTGGGAVDSVNTQTGDVVLDADDIDDTSTTNKFVTAAQKSVIDDQSGVNTGDQDLSTLVPKTTTVNGHALSSNVSVTKSDVSLGNADDTSDINKPVSTAQQTALDAKLDDTQLDIDSTMAANSDAKIASQKATKTALATKQDSLGFTAEDSANKDTDSTMTANSDTKYPSQKAVKTALATKQNSLGFTAEDVANKDTDTTLAANSDTKYPSQKATKAYVDNSATPDATSSTKGKLKLTGQLGGTADSPTVPGLIARKNGGLTVIAHSFTAGTTQTDSGVGNVYQESLISKLQGLLGIHENNVNHYGQAGSKLSNPINPITASPFAGWGGALQFVVPNNSTNINASGDVVVTDPPVAGVGTGVIVHGVNDFNIGYTSATAIAAAQPTYIQTSYAHALRSVIARMRMGVLYDSYVTAGAITWDTVFNFAGGTWSDVASVTQNSGAAYKQSSTNNDTIVYTIPTSFSGGYIDLGFIGQPNILSTCSTVMNNTDVSTVITVSAAFTQASGFYIIMGTEQMLVTAGGTGTSWTVTRGANSTTKTTHAAADVIQLAPNHQVAFSTNGSNATITGTQKLGAQGNAGKPVAIVKRFLCTSADAGKTITMTFSGIPASDTYSQFWFDCVGLEAQDPPSVVVTNLHHWRYGNSIYATESLISGFNTMISNVVAEFDSFVQIADVYTPYYNRHGVTTASMNNTDSSTAIGWACNSSSFTPTVGMKFSFGGFVGEHCVVSAVSGSAPNWTLTLTRGIDGTSKASHSSGSFLAPLAWMSQIDDIHLSASGHSVYATTIYDSLKAITTNGTYQQALYAGNWSQYSQSVSMGIIDNNWVVPPSNAAFVTVSTTTQNRQWAIPLYIPKTCIVVGMATATNVASQSGVIRYGIYLPDATHSRPGRLLVDFGAFTYTTTSNWTTTGLYQILRPGWYWISAAVQGTAVAMRGYAANSLEFPFLSSSTAPVAVMTGGTINGYGQTGISGAFADWSSYTELNGVTAATGVPLIGVQLRAIKFS